MAGRGGTPLGFECVSRTDPGLKRKVNEDSMMVRTERGLWAVADGMGGHEAGDVASGKVVEALPSRRSSTDRGFVDDALLALKGSIMTDPACRVGPMPRTIGTTVVGLAIAGEPVPLLLGR